MQNEEFVLILGTLVFLVLTAFIVVFIVLYRKARLKLIIDQQKFRQEILQAEIEIRENTLREVGRDIHDNLGQIASLVRINLAGIIENAGSSAQISNSVELMDELIDEMRDLSHSLTDGNRLSLGLNGRIESDLKRLHHLEELTIEKEGSLPEGSLDQEREILLYRIFQEALTNALKHSDASRIRIKLAEETGIIHLEVTDNGKGFNPKVMGGNGIMNMKSRAAIMGGTITLANANPSGTTLTVNLPRT